MSMAGGSSSGGGGSLPPVRVRVVISTTGAGSAVGAMRAVTGASTMMGRSMMTGSITTRTLGDAMRQMASLMKYTIAGGFMNVGRQAIQMSRQFELSFSRIKGLVGIGADSMEIMKKRVLELSGETSKAPIELADALYYITSAGIKEASTALDVLETSAKAAAAGLGETKVVADAITSTLNAYGQETYSAAKVGDILVATVREGKAEADTFAQALGKVLPVSAAFGASFEDVSAAIAALSRGGLTAGTAAIYIRQTLSQLLKPSKQAQEVLKQVGTSAEAIRTEVAEQGLFVALENLSTKLGGIKDGAEQFTKVFGNVRALTAVLSLVGPAADENRVIFERLQNTAGDLDYAYGEYADTIDAQFNRQLAASQAALIELGDALKPITSTLLAFGTAIAKVVGGLVGGDGALSGIIRNFVRFGGAIVIGVAAMAAVIKTMASFVRMASQLSTVVQGSIFGVRGLTATILQYNTAAVTSAAATSTYGTMTSALASFVGGAAAAQHAMNAATAAGNLSARAAIQIKIAELQADGQGIRNKLQLIALQRAEKLASDEGNLTKAQAITLTNILTSSNGILAASFNVLGLAVRRFMMALGPIMAIFSIATLAFSFFRKNTDDVGKAASQAGDKLQNLNEVLDETLQYARSGLSIDVEVNYGTDQQEIDRIREQLGEDFITGLADVGGDVEQKAAYAQSIILTTFAKATKETKAKVAGILAAGLGIDATDISNAMIPPTTGDEIADAITQRAYQGMVDANIDTGLIDPLVSGLDPKQGATDLARYFRDIYKNVDYKSVRPKEFATEFGKGFTEGLQKTQDIAPFLKNMQRLNNSVRSFGLSAEQQSMVISGFVSGALKDLTGDFDLVSESSGNVGDVFKDTRNETKLLQFMQESLGGTARENRMRLEELRTALEGVKGGQEGAAEAASIVVDFFDDFKSKADELAQANIDLGTAILDVTEQFNEGLNPAIGAIVSQYDAAREAIKNYEEGQKAVLGLGKDFVEENIDFRDALRGVGDAAKESGGALLGSGEKADEAKGAVIKAVEELLDVVNVKRAMGDLAGATADLSAGTAQIMAVALANGIKQQDVQALFEAIGFGKNIEDTLIGAREAAVKESSDVGTAITTGLAKGLASQEPLLRQAVYDQANNVLQWMKDFWVIKSPSQTAQVEIGGPIGTGTVRGMSDAATSPSAMRIVAGIGDIYAKQVALGYKVALNKVFSAQLLAKNETLGEKVSNPLAASLYKALGVGDIGDTDLDDVVRSAGKGSKDAGKDAGKNWGKAFKKGVTAELAKKFLEAKKDFETPILDLIDQVIGDASDALDTIGDYIDAQLDLRNALADNIKLQNKQVLLASNLAKAERAQRKATRMFGLRGGAEITDYEQSQIEELQKAYERVARDYSMRRATYSELIDAEETLNEARIAAGEESEDVVDSQNDVIDAQEALKNKGLEASKAIYEVVKAQSDLVTAATNFKLNGDLAARVFAHFADQALPGLEYRISTATGVIHKAGIELSEDGGLFLRSIKGLGQKIYDALEAGIKEAQTKSTVPTFFPKVEEPKAPSRTEEDSGGRAADNVVGPVEFRGETYYLAVTRNADKMSDAVARDILSGAGDPMWLAEQARIYGAVAFADGGIVTKPTLGMVGEAGPEAIIPLSRIGILTALEQLSPSRQPGMMESSSSNQNFYITVNNPVPEPASDSISRRMKALAATGLFA